MMIFIRSIVLLFGCCLTVARAADTGWLSSPDNAHAAIRLQAEKAEGNAVRLLLDVHLEEGWKTYWRSPGEGGVVPHITWQQGVSARWNWPVPQRVDVSGLTAQGYKHRVSFPLILPPDTSPLLKGY